MNSPDAHVVSSGGLEVTAQRVKLPPLPEADGTAEIVVGRNMDADVVEYVPAWTESLVRAYALLAIQQERERCVAVAVAVIDDALEQREPATSFLDERVAAAIRKA